MAVLERAIAMAMIRRALERVMFRSIGAILKFATQTRSARTILTAFRATSRLSLGRGNRSPRKYSRARVLPERLLSRSALLAVRPPADSRSRWRSTRALRASRADGGT